MPTRTRGETPPTLLVVTHHREDRLRALVAQSERTTMVCAPDEAAAILRHVAVDLLMILEDVSRDDRLRVKAELTSRTAIVASLPFATDALERRIPLRLPAFAAA